jgi:hypothetical protein
MDDGLAEKLYNAFWDPLVERGWPKPCGWAALHTSQREAWEQVAIAARAHAAAQVNDEIVMLRGANDAWQRVNDELRDELACLRIGPIGP